MGPHAAPEARLPSWGGCCKLGLQGLYGSSWQSLGTVGINPLPPLHPGYSRVLGCPSRRGDAFGHWRCRTADVVTALSHAWEILRRIWERHRAMGTWVFVRKRKMRTGIPVLSPWLLGSRGLLWPPGLGCAIPVCARFRGCSPRAVGAGCPPGTGVAVSTHPQSRCVPCPVASATGFSQAGSRGIQPCALPGQLPRHPRGAGPAAVSALAGVGLIFHKNRIQRVNRWGCSLFPERGAGAGAGNVLVAGSPSMASPGAHCFGAVRIFWGWGEIPWGELLWPGFVSWPRVGSQRAQSAGSWVQSDTLGTLSGFPRPWGPQLGPVSQEAGPSCMEAAWQSCLAPAAGNGPM